MPQKFISDTVLRQVRDLPGYPELKILDLSCGEAYIISELKREGCQVTGTHFIEDDYIINKTERLEGLDIVKGVNLHEAIPFNDEQFDLVMLIEVIEHLDHYNKVISEACRVVKTNGHVIITTPNKYRLHSRLQFMFSGNHKLIQRRLSWDLGNDDLYANHIHMADLPLLSVLLHHGRAEIVRLLNTRTKWKHIYMLPAFMINWLIHTMRIMKFSGRNDKRSEGDAAISRMMRSFNCCFSEQLAIVARKKGS